MASSVQVACRSFRPFLCHFVRWSVIRRRLSRYQKLENSNSLKSGVAKEGSRTVEYPRQIVSGIQPTGIPHIGNYLGAVKHWVELQREEAGVIFSVVDLHSITLPQDPDVLRCNILDMVACLLACGIDPDRSTLFLQSSEKSKEYKEVGVGLLTYPILQAADILVYRATHVPVGEDQIHHIELCRHLAKLFNNKYEEFFPLPDVLPGPVAKIRSLRDPSAKMSKSDPNTKAQINLNDTPDQIREKIKKAVTDFTGAVTYDPEQRPGVSNLIDIHQGFTGLSHDKICEQSLHLDTAMYKMELADVVIENLNPIRVKIEEYQRNRDYLHQVLERGRQKAQEIAEHNMSTVRKRVGFR